MRRGIVIPKAECFRDYHNLKEYFIKELQLSSLLTVIFSVKIDKHSTGNELIWKSILNAQHAVTLSAGVISYFPVRCSEGGGIECKAA